MVYRTTPKMAERKAAHRAHLLSTAVRLFGAHGYHVTTVPMIVNESGSEWLSSLSFWTSKKTPK